MISTLRYRRVSASLSLGILTAMVLVFATAFALSPSAEAQTYNVLYSFSGGSDGNLPVGTMVLDSSGNLYGATKAGGDLTCSISQIGCGVVFKLSPNGTFTVMHAFHGGTDGAEPLSGVVRNSKGELFGTTSRGGDPSCAWGQGNGCGTIYKIDANGNETVIHAFNGLNEGTDPSAPLLQDAAGNLWGSTQFEGVTTNPSCFGGGCGTLFRVGPQLGVSFYEFQGPPNDGFQPTDRLAAGPGGDLFGTTRFGGTTNSGTIFKVGSRSGKVTILHSFDPSVDGGNPGPILVSGNKIYGLSGPINDFSGGIIFQFDQSGLNVFFNFDQSAFPVGNLLRDTSGNFYGQRAFIQDGGGEIFKIDATSKLTVLHSFGLSGNFSSWIIADGHGGFYGVASGAEAGAGTIFKLTP